MGAVGRHRRGRSGCARGAAPGRRGRAPVADRDLDAVSRCSRRRPASRTSPGGAAPGLPRRARGPADPGGHAAPSPALRGGRRSGCSPPTAAKGLEWDARRGRRRAGGRAGRTCAAAARCSTPDGSAGRRGDAAGPDRRRGSPRSGGCSTSPCTRARRRLVVTAVDGHRGRRRDQPSRFLAELGVPVRRAAAAAAPAADPAGPGRRAPPRQRRPGRRTEPARSGRRPAGPARRRRRRPTGGR